MYAIVPDTKLYYNDQKLCQIIVDILNIIKWLWYKLIFIYILIIVFRFIFVKIE